MPEKIVRIHICDICGKQGRWSSHWSWYGSRVDEENGTLKRICSEPCKQKFEAMGKPMPKIKRNRYGG